MARNIALDLGEGSLAQMIRRYGAEDVETKLTAMRLVWISHIHADHHVGLTAWPAAAGAAGAMSNRRRYPSSVRVRCDDS